jgi:hypothetical protein
MKRLTKEKEEAIKMRLKGMSYSQIKLKIKVSKSSLSMWLAPYPLSDERIKELRDVNPRRIENYRKTMASKRQARLDLLFQRAQKEIGHISPRDLLILGFALYWSEGAKTKNASLYMANTDPSMLKVYMKWLKIMKVPKNKLKFKLHIYKDMNERKAVNFWAKTLGVKTNQFRKTYVKNSKLTDLTYKSGFGCGTCNVMFDNVEMVGYVLMGIKHIISEVTNKHV